MAHAMSTKGHSIETQQPSADLRPRFWSNDSPGLDDDSLRPFLRSGVRVDRIGLATVLTLGTAVGRRTVVEGVEARTVEPHGLAAPRIPNDSEIVELVIDAVRRHVGDCGPVVPLSGGRDSRLILLAMKRLGLRPRALCTLAQHGAESDCAVAHRLASAVGLDIETIDPTAFDGSQELDRHLRQSFQSLEHGWFVPVAAELRSRCCPVTDGIGAGVLHIGTMLHPEAIALWRDGATRDLMQWMVARSAGVSPEFLAAARAEGLPVGSEDDVVQEFATVLRALEGTPNPLGLFSLLHWTHRGIGGSAYGLLDPSMVRTPLYDRALCGALAAIPFDRAMAHDWREVALASLDRTGVRYSRGEGGLLPRWLRHPRRTAASRFGWARFVAGLPAPLARLAAVADSGSGGRRAFDRAAVGLLASLDRETGFVSGAVVERRGIAA